MAVSGKPVVWPGDDKFLEVLYEVVLEKRNKKREDYPYDDFILDGLINEIDNYEIHLAEVKYYGLDKKNNTLTPDKYKNLVTSLLPYEKKEVLKTH